MARSLTLILGGARSGKSSWAEKLALESGGPVLYVATAEAGDAEMAARIARHRADRPALFRTLEAPRRAGEAIASAGGNHQVVLVDCFTLLASNALAALPESESLPAAELVVAAEWAVEEEAAGLLDAFGASAASWIVVSNEVGLGVVPPYPLGRAFRDALGRANQRLAGAADSVLFLAAGLPLRLK